MKKHLVFYSTREMSQEEWIRFRKRGIGASDIGTLLGLNPYKSKLELFHEKIGEGIGYNVENIFMFMGKVQEDFVAEMWQYWEGSEESMIRNYRAGKVVRKCQRVNAYVVNPEFPWLFVSLDRKINKGSRGEGALELKTISGYEANKWESGIPPGHIVQLQTQIMACEFHFGELCVLKDGRRFEVYPFEEIAGIQERIASEGAEFWSRVEKARSLLTQKYEAVRGFNMKLAEEIDEQIQILEPEPDGTEAYEKYLHERYKNKQLAEVGLIPGDEFEYRLACQHKEMISRIRNMEEESREISSKLKKRIGDAGSVLDFGQRGRVSWKPDSSGNRRFVNSVKLE